VLMLECSYLAIRADKPVLISSLLCLLTGRAAEAGAAAVPAAGAAAGLRGAAPRRAHRRHAAALPPRRQAQVLRRGDTACSSSQSGLRTALHSSTRREDHIWTVAQAVSCTKPAAARLQICFPHAGPSAGGGLVVGHAAAQPSSTTARQLQWRVRLWAVPLSCAPQLHPSSAAFHAQVVGTLFGTGLRGEGNILHHLRHCAYRLAHEQSPLHEYDFAVYRLAGDLCDGLRLCKLAEKLTGAASPSLQQFKTGAPTWLQWLPASSQLTAYMQTVLVPRVFDSAIFLLPAMCSGFCSLSHY